jgi:trans-aconitate methyltransferase
MVLTPQQWNVDDYHAFGHFVPVYGEDVLALLKPLSGERILDVGCGEGSLTRKIMEAGAQVVGIDADAAMVDAARKAGVDAHVMSGTQMAFTEEFDAVFSNAALHWMKPPEAVVQNIFRALRSGGRLVVEMGGKGNVQSARSIFTAQLDKRGINGADFDPWYFPASEEYTALLQDAGFKVLHTELYDRPTAVGGDVAGWLKTFGGTFTAALPQGEREGFLAEASAELRAIVPFKDGQYWLDYVRLRFVAVKPS